MSHPNVMLGTAAVAAALGLAACGGGGGGGGSAATAPATSGGAAAGATTTPAAPGSPQSVPTSPTAVFIFDAGKLLPPVRQMPVATQVTLVLISADRRAHSATVQTPAGRVRVKVRAADRGEAVLRRLKPGRYRIVPSGSTKPAVLQVG
jgi:hypothetical protein